MHYAVSSASYNRTSLLPLLELYYRCYFAFLAGNAAAAVAVTPEGGQGAFGLASAAHVHADDAAEQATTPTAGLAA